MGVGDPSASSPKPKAKRKARPRSSPRPTGRPSIWQQISPESGPLQLTREAHLLALLKATGCSLNDAATYAGISHDTLYRRLANDSDFQYQIDQQLVFFKVGTLGAIAAAARAGNLEAAKWYLERRYPSEFRITADPDALDRRDRIADGRVDEIRRLAETDPIAREQMRRAFELQLTAIGDARLRAQGHLVELRDTRFVGDPSPIARESAASETEIRARG